MKKQLIALSLISVALCSTAQAMQRGSHIGRLMRAAFAAVTAPRTHLRIPTGRPTTIRKVNSRVSTEPWIAQFKDREKITIGAVNNLTVKQIKQLLKDQETKKNLIDFCADNITKLNLSTFHRITTLCPAAAKKFAPHAAQNITQVGSWLIAGVVEHSQKTVPMFIKTVTMFTQRAAQNFTEMKPDALEIILARNRNAATAFTQPAAQNMAKVDPSILEKIMQRNPEAAMMFTQPAAQNITAIDQDVLCKIMQLNSEAAKVLTQPAAQNITAIDQDVLCKIMQRNSEATKVFTQPASQNIAKMDPSILKKIMERNPEAAKAFAQPAAQNIATMDPSILEEIMERNPEAARIFAQAFARNTHPVSSLCFYQILKKIHEQKDQESLVTIKKALKKQILKSDEDSIDGKLKRIIFKKYFEPNGLLTQTEQHMLTNLKALKKFINTFNISADLIEQLYQQVTKLEADLQQKGYCTFVHGQRWEYRLAEEWYTKLWCLKNSKPVQNYLFIHVKPQPVPEEIEQEKTTREQLLKLGRFGASLRQRILFMNYALFGNLKNPGSNSTFYMIKNNNAGQVAISLENLFEHLGFQEIYAKYEEELTQLEKEHKELSEYGNMLLIGVPKNTTHECVYLAQVGGRKKMVDIKGIGATDDINLIIDTLRTAPEKISDSDCLEFCMAMTWDIALNPESGIKAFSLNVADQEKLVAFNKKSDELFARIKQDICSAQENC